MLTADQVAWLDRLALRFPSIMVTTDVICGGVAEVAALRSSPYAAGGPVDVVTVFLLSADGTAVVA